MMASPEEPNEQTRHAELVQHNREHFDEKAESWDDDPEYVQVSRESHAALEEHLGPSLHGTRVLDFGCGTGLLAARLRRDAKEVVGVDVSGGMVERMRRKIEREGWDNVEALRLDVLDEGDANAAKLPRSDDGFDLVVSCYTFHHLRDVAAIGRKLTGCLKPGGYFCIIDFEARGAIQELHSSISESAKASIGTHDGFGKDFLLDFYQNQLGLKNVQVHPACTLKCKEDKYPTFIAYGQK